LYIEITNIDGEKLIDESEEILKKLLRLAQIASNPSHHTLLIKKVDRHNKCTP
jgi:hypothetical protein